MKKFGEDGKMLLLNADDEFLSVDNQKADIYYCFFLEKSPDYGEDIVFTINEGRRFFSSTPCSKGEYKKQLMTRVINGLSAMTHEVPKGDHCVFYEHCLQLFDEVPFAFYKHCFDDARKAYNDFTEDKT